MILLFVIYKKIIPSDPMSQTMLKMSFMVRKPVFGVSDLVQHRRGCTATENGLRFELTDL